MEPQQLLDWIRDVWASLVWLSITLSVGHIIAATAVTWDALFRKSRPSVALLWITLVWGVPFLGELLYLLFGINRVQRRAMHDREGLARPDIVAEKESWPGTWPQGMRSLARLIDRNGEWQLASGNEITPLFDGDEAYPKMLAAIDAAEKTVWLQTYIFDREGPGLEFAEALERAEGRGVDVRVIIDDASRFHASSPVERLLRRKGIARTSFMPRRWWLRLISINLRNHRKILVVDGETAFTGGMNILPGHRIKDTPNYPVKDVHFCLRGPVVQQLLAVFIEDWSFCAGEILSMPERAVKRSAAGAWACGIPDGPDEDFKRLSTVFAGGLSCSNESVWIASPYFLPDEVLTSQLTLAARRGVDVNIVVPGRNNHPLVKWASESCYPELLEAGCRIIETSGDFDHSKLMLVDRLFFSIGSANWDDRSLRLNYEFNVVGFDVDLSRQLIGVLEQRVSEIGETLQLEEMNQWSRLRRMRNRLCRLASPFL